MQEHPVAQPSAPLAQVSRPTLRPVEHPDQSALLTHFCHRAAGKLGLPIEILQMSAPQQL
jgi:hypothetical protein